MTETSVTTGVFDTLPCSSRVCWEARCSYADDRIAQRDMERALCVACRLPERADMPRIMDEREMCDHSDEWVEHITGYLEREPRGTRVTLCTGCGSTMQGPRTDDTRTREQLNDGCVTGCSCNGSTVEYPSDPTGIDCAERYEDVTR